jgi:hypothetical protein
VLEFELSLRELQTVSGIEVTLSADKPSFPFYATCLFLDGPMSDDELEAGILKWEEWARSQLEVIIDMKVPASYHGKCTRWSSKVCSMDTSGRPYDLGYQVIDKDCWRSFLMIYQDRFPVLYQVKPRIFMMGVDIRREVMPVVFWKRLVGC